MEREGYLGQGLVSGDAAFLSFLSFVHLFWRQGLIT